MTVSNPSPNALHSQGSASQGPWHLAWAGRTGSRHIQAGKPCEDSLAHRFGWQGGAAIALGDGVSGGALGQAASEAATLHCTAWQPPGRFAFPAYANPQAICADLAAHIDCLDSVVRQSLLAHTQRTGATTLAAAWLRADGTGWLTQVGDVRTYTWQPEVTSARVPLAQSTQLTQLTRLTTDQTYTALGEIPPLGVPPDNPARMLGNGSVDQVALLPILLPGGYGLLLCSDGLHGFVSDRELAAFLGGATQHAGPSRHPVPLAQLAHTARRLVKAAIHNGSDDDIAVMLLYHCVTSP